jgi:hypothetical protein
MQTHKIFFSLVLALCIHLHCDFVYGLNTDSLRKCVQEVYSSQVGVRELTGKNDGPEVKQYLASVKLKEGFAWCAAFVNYCLESCSIKTPKSGWVPSWLIKERIIYNSKQIYVAGNYTKPLRGDLIFLYNKEMGRPAHIGFVDEWGDEYVKTVEGNTNTAGGREGNGVYRKIRPIRTIYAVVDIISQF